MHAEHDGVRLTDFEVVSHVRLLYAVGATTTSDSMSSLFWTLLTHPELLERRDASPSCGRASCTSSCAGNRPLRCFRRVAPRGGEIAGVSIPEGGILLAAVASANRDETVFDDPDRFDPDREQGELLTFGFGNKFCPGSHLARRQLLAALDVVLERLPNLRLVAADPPSGGILRRTERLEAAWN